MGNKKVDLCLIIEAPTMGGAQTVLLQLAHEFNRDRFDISMIMLNSKGQLSHMIPDDIRIIDLKRSVDRKYAWLINPLWFFRLINSIKSIEPDAILTTITGMNLCVIFAKLLARADAIVIVRETITLKDSLKTGMWVGKLKKWLCVLLYPRANKVVAPSQVVIDDLRSFIKLEEEQVAVIPNFVNPKRMDQYSSQPVDLGALRLQTDRPVIVSVGRLVRQKGFDIGIESVERVNRKFPCYYWIVGEGEEERNLREHVASRGLSNVVSFLGYQENPFLFLKHADLFLMPSRYEGFPNVLLEAMYCSLACIVTRYDRSVEEFLVDRENGYLTEPGDAASMAGTIEELLANPMLSRRIGRKAKERVRRFDIRLATDEYERLFVNG